MPLGRLLDLWECHKQYNRQAKPKREYFMDELSRTEYDRKTMKK